MKQLKSCMYEQSIIVEQLAFKVVAPSFTMNDHQLTAAAQFSLAYPYNMDSRYCTTGSGIMLQYFMVFNIYPVIGGVRVEGSSLFIPIQAVVMH